MPNYKRLRVPGGTYFFTVNLAERGGRILTDHIADLRSVYAAVAEDMPFATRAIVVLPDHLHAVWTLPDGDADFSTRWKRIKRDFSVRLGIKRARSLSQIAKGEARIWQRRFWEHRIRDQAELSTRVRYVWANPVRHGLVEQATDWPFSSIHRELRRGCLAAEAP